MTLSQAGTLSGVTDAGGELVLDPSHEAVRQVAGITREGKLGSIGFRIGRRAGESVMDALRNGLVDERVALWIADFCPGNDVVQRRGLEAALRDAGKAEVLARMEAELARRQMQEEMGLDGGMDLFGNALDNDAFMDFVAQYVVRRRNELAQDASFLNATAKKRNAEAIGKKYGVDVKDPAALKRKLEEVDALRERWKNPYSDSGLMDEIRAAWRGRGGDDVPADAVAGRVETPSEKLFREYAAGAWRTEGVDFSAKSEGLDYVTDKNGNPVPIADLVERVHRENRDRLAELGKDPRYAGVMGKIRDAIRGKITKAFDYRDLNEAEVSFFRDRLGFDLRGYAWQLTPDNLKTVLKAGKRGKYSFSLTEDELGLIPVMIDDIAESNTATVQSNVKAITPGGTVFVKVYNPLTRMEMDFRLTPKKKVQKRYDNPEEKKKTKLNLTSARAFLGHSAGLAPTRPPKSVPSDADNSTAPAGTVKENLLKQEFSSRDTSINSAKTPAVYNMVDKIGGWHEGSVNIDVGGGKYDTLTRALADKGVTSYIYEPYGRTINENAYILAQLQSNALRGDTATCSNVLNVIKESDMRANVVHQVAKAIKPEGVAYFTIYEGNKAGRGAVSKDDCWQNNRRVGTYVDEVRQHFGDVQMKGNLIIARKPLHTGIPAEWRLGADGGVVHFSFTDNDGNLHNLGRAYATDAQANNTAA